jgi:hypothetical protein
MEQEAEQGSFTVPISKAQERTEAATGVTVRTVRKIKSVWLPLDKETRSS